MTPISLNRYNINLLDDNHIGCYRIFSIDNNGNPIVIQRFAAFDTNGLLYIGRSHRQSLKKRLMNFLLSSDPILNTHNHSGALKYKLNPIIRETLGNNHSLYFDYFYCKDFEESKELENNYLKSYSDIYGEYPVLNK